MAMFYAARKKDAMGSTWYAPRAPIGIYGKRCPRKAARRESGDGIGVTKTDQCEIRRETRTFVYDVDQEALSAARAIKSMLGQYQSTGEKQYTYVSLSWQRTGIDFRRLEKVAKTSPIASRIEIISLKPHRLQIVAATAYGNCADGGEIIATMYGGWSSDARNAKFGSKTKYGRRLPCFITVFPANT